MTQSCWVIMKGTITKGEQYRHISRMRLSRTFQDANDIYFKFYRSYEDTFKTMLDLANTHVVCLEYEEKDMPAPVYTVVDIRDVDASGVKFL